MRLRIGNIVLATLWFTACAFAQRKVFHVDPETSSVEFTLGDVLHTVHGTFHVQSGAISFDTAKIDGSVVVGAGSGKSGNDTRDRKMSTEILDATHFAEVSFIPHSYQGTIAAEGDSTVQVTGVFTIHGIGHDLTMPVKIHLEGSACTAKAHIAVPYVKWGMKDPSTFVLRVAKEVQIDLTLAGRLSDGN
jgi:polyisoprenoid-binding protein YceI